jgi:hypothetical protein
MAGIFGVFRQTDTGAANPGLVGRLVGLWQAARRRPADVAATTEQGTSATASPAVEQFQLWQLRYERRAVIADLRRLADEEPRFARALRKLAREAVRKGVRVTIAEGPSRGPVAARYKRAKEILERAIKVCDLNPVKLRSWAWSLPLEGDLFVQIVVADGQVVDAKRMPAASMERNTDAQDRFFDVTRAFSQIDVQTNADITQFAAWQIHHERWNHLDGERYGRSEYLPLRRPARNLQLLEQAQVIRRIVRAALRLLHKVGSKDKPGLAKDVEDYKAFNNLAAQSKGGFDPTIAMRDYYGNGLTEVVPIPGDPNVHEIADLEYFRDAFAAGTGAPKAMLGWADREINRDILKDQIEQWLKEVQDLTDAIENVLRTIMDLALLLEGIDPETVPYDLVFSQNSTETASERQARVAGALKAGLIPLRVAVGAISEDYDFGDVDAVVEELKAERAERQAQTLEVMRARGRSGAGEDRADSGNDPQTAEEGKDRSRAKSPARTG